MKKIQILISTYNGEKFLREQLNSILGQSYQNFEILIRDDGSTDGTIKILKEYEAKKKIKIIYGKNKGVVESFLELMNQESEYEYYALADQDDYWHQDKLLTMLDAIEENSEDIPILCVSNFEIVSSNLSIIKKSYYESEKIEFSIKNSLIENSFPGCVYFYNYKLKKIFTNTLVDKKAIIMHDYFIYMLATFVGKVIYVPKCLIKYRQHENNVIGSYKKNRLLKNLFNSLNNTKKQERIKRQVELLMEIYENKILKENKKIIENYLEAKTFYKRLTFLKKYGLKKNNNNLYMLFRYIFNVY